MMQLRWMTLCLALALAFCSPAHSEWAVEMHGPRPARTFAVDEPVTLAVTVTDPVGDRVAWVLSSSAGREIARGELALAAGQGHLDLGKLPYGYYTLKLTQGDQTHQDNLVVLRLADPKDHGPAASVFGVSFAAKGQPAELAAQQIGVRWLRVEPAWGGWEPQPGKFQFASFETEYQQLHDEGFRLLATVGYSPPWAGLKPQDAKPGSRQAVATHTWAYRSNVEWSDAAQQYWLNLGKVQDEIELWNEVDINFGYLPAQRHSEMIKIFGSWLRAVHPESRLINGASASWSWPGVATVTGAVDYLDLQNAHYPAKGGDLEPDPAKDEGIESPLASFLAFQPYEKGNWWLPLVVTEGSVYTDQTNDFATAFLTSGVTKIYTQAIATGQTRYWSWFTLTGGGNWGLLEPVGNPRSPSDYRPKPSYAAYATARALLEPALFIGRASADPAQRRYLFAQPDGTLMLVAWQRDAQTADAPILLAGATGQVTESTGETATVKGPTAQIALSRLTPRYIEGVSPSYLATAVKDQVDREWHTWRQFPDALLAATKQGHAYSSDLNRDVARLAPDAAAKVDLPVAAVAALPDDVAVKPDSVTPVLDATIEAARAVSEKAKAPGQFGPAMKTFDRLVEAADHTRMLIQALRRAGRQPRPTWTDARATAVRKQYDDLVKQLDDTVKPVSDKPMVRECLRNYLDYSLDCAERDHDASRLDLVERLLPLIPTLIAAEPSQVTQVFTTTDWPAECYIVKGYRMIAGATHQVTVNVHNFGPNPARATVDVALPAGFEATPAQFTVEVPAGGIKSTPVAIKAPAAATGPTALTVNARLDTGQPLAPMGYPFKFVADQG